MTTTEQLLNDNIHRLTREHKTTHTDHQTGKLSYPTEMSLFDQLRLEQASGRRNTGSSGSGSRSPIAVQAVVLWSEIRETLNTMLTSITGTDDLPLPPEAKLQKWGRLTLGDPTGRNQKTCLRHAATWAQAIESLINPQRRIEITGTCPVESCHASHAWTWDEDEWVRNTAVTATGREAQCGACGSTWEGNDLHDLPTLMEKAAVRLDEQSPGTGMLTS